MHKTQGRRIAFGGCEHQSRECHALHIHVDGLTTYFGNGREVTVVVKDKHRPFVEVWGEGDDPRHWSGDPFRYEDYFLREEIGERRSGPRRVAKDKRGVSRLDRRESSFDWREAAKGAS